jgi:hypothetical protein
MARKINPFAVCKAAGKRGRWPKKKVERCIRAVKKSVGMGHISDRNLRETEKIVTSRCVKAYKNDRSMTSNEREIAEDACVLGAKNAVRLLESREGIREE